jgi:hypothetical protein
MLLLFQNSSLLIYLYLYLLKKQLQYHLNHVHLDGTGLPETLFEKTKLGLLIGNSMASAEELKDRPFACVVAGCGKTYKNLNGLKVCHRQKFFSLGLFDRLTNSAAFLFS